MIGRIPTTIELHTIEALGIPPEQAGPICAAGIDVRPMSWDLLIADIYKPPRTRTNPNPEPIPRLIFDGKLPGEAECLYFLRQYKVKVALADAGPEGTLVIRMANECPKYGIDFWRVWYRTTVNPIIAHQNQTEKVIGLKKYVALDTVAETIAFRRIGFPTNVSQLLEGQFVAELKAISRGVEHTPRGPVPTWHSKGPDHSPNALAYLLTAMREFKLLDFSNVGPIESVGTLPHKAREDDEEGNLDHYHIESADI